MGLVVVGEDAAAVPTCAAAVFSIRVAGLLTYYADEYVICCCHMIYRIQMFQTEMFPWVHTMTGDATFTVVVPGVTATVLRIVAPAGTLRTVPADEGGIFCVAAAAAAKAAMPLI